jgi:tyrosine-specific transport protein
MPDHRPSRTGLRAAFVLFGTIVGAGIFGLPYVVQKAGYLPGLFWMAVLAGVVTLTHLMFGEVVMATPGNYRMIGYVGKYLGPWARRVETVSSFLGLFGSSLAYLILGGLFIKQIVAPVMTISQTAGAAVLLAFGIAAVWAGTRFLSGVDFWLTLVEFSSFALLTVVALTAIRPEYLATVHWAEFFFPYGIVLFAYGGLTAIAEVREMVGDRPAVVRRSIVIGTLTAAGLTIAFVTAVTGALGPMTTEEAVGGLNARFGGAMPMLGAVAGFFSILTSYVVFAEYLKNQLLHDFKWKFLPAAAVAVGAPFLLYLLGIRSFGRVLELVGATLIGIEGVFVCLLYLKVRKAYPDKVMKIPYPIVYLLIAAYGSGAGYELFFRLLKGH